MDNKIRVGGAIQLSEKAYEKYKNSPNKSEFLKKSIEFYVHHGIEILSKLEKIDEMHRILTSRTFEGEIRSGKVIHEQEGQTGDKREPQKLNIEQRATGEQKQEDVETFVQQTLLNLLNLNTGGEL